MEKKTLKKILVIAIVFILTFSNCGYTLQALASSEGLSFLGLNLFGNNMLDFDAYFLDSEGKKQESNVSNVNGEATLVVELEPKEEGYLKSGTIKAIAEEGETNFEIKEVFVGELEEGEITQLFVPDTTLLKTEQFVSIPVENSNKTDNDTENKQENIKDSIISELPSEVENNESVTNTVSNDDAQNESNAVTNSVFENIVVENTTGEDNKIDNTVPVETTEENVVEEELVDEEEIANEKLEAEEEEVKEVKALATATVISENEVKVENVIEPTKLYLKLRFKQGEVLNVSDLYKQMSLELTGKYINVDLEEVEISAKKDFELGWSYSKDIVVSSEYTKVSPFEVVDTKGTVIENKIIVKREIEDEKYLPLKKTIIELEVPEVYSKKPIAMGVSANKLNATKGQEINEVVFTEENWEYNEKKNTLTITVENTEAKYTYGEDIYVVTYRYEDYVQENEINLVTKGKVTVEEFSGKENNIISKGLSKEEKLVVNVGELITYSIGTTEEKINRAKINANYNSAEPVYETEFGTTVNINILTNDVLKEFTLKNTKEFYIDKQNLEFEATDVKYRKINFQYAEIAKLLENGGSIEIRCNSGELLYTLNSELIKSQEDCEIEIRGDVTGVEISFKNITVNGNITVGFLKSIGKCNFDKSAFNNFEKIESRINAEVKYMSEEAGTELKPIKTEKYFEDSFTSAELELDRDNLSTIENNENVEIKIALNNHLETSDLYVNPVFEIVFPKYVTNVEPKGTNLLYEDELRVKSTVTFKDEDVVKMQIALEGVQTRFSTGTLTNGTNIIVNANIEVDDYTPKKVDQLRMYYYNEGVTNYESQTKWTVKTDIPTGILKTTNGFDVDVFTFQAPNGFVAINEIENYDGANSKVTSIKQGEETREVAMKTGSQSAKMRLIALNNTGNDCTDVNFLGRIPVKDATDVQTGENLGNNVDTIITSIIMPDDNNPISSTIYYSPNPNATKVLTDANNGWTETPEDLTKMKSFLIVPMGKVAEGTVFKYTYDFQIPENLPYEAKMYGSFGAFYNNHSDVAVVYETTVADKVGLFTKAGPKLDAALSVDIGDGATVQGGKRLKYTITIVNSGSVTMDNIVINAPIPENSVYVANQESNKDMGDYGFLTDASKEELSYNIDVLNPGETKEFSYYIQAGFKETLEEYSDGKDENGYFKYNGDEKEYITEVPKKIISNKVTVNSPLLVETIESNEVKNEIEYVNFIIETGIDYDRSLDPETETNFRLYVKNISGNELKSVEAVFCVGKVYEYTSAIAEVEGNQVECDITFDSENGKIHFSLGNMEKNAVAIIYLKVNAKKITTMKEEYNCRFEIKSEDMEKAEVGTTIPQKVEIPWIKAEDISINVPNTINEGDSITISTQIDNISNRNVLNASYECEIPNCLDVVSVTTEDTSLSSLVIDGNVKDILPMIIKDESLTIDMTLKAKNMPGVDSTKVVLDRIVKNDNQEDIKITPVEFTILNTQKTEEEILEEEKEAFEKAEEEFKKEQEDNKEQPEEDFKQDTNQPEEKPVVPPNNELEEENKVPEDNKENNNENEENNTVEPEDNTPVIEEKNTYSITGRAWYDENKNGIREDNEKGLASIKVYLLTTNNHMIKSTTTNSNGIYTFDKLENGKYIVAFNYDTNVYTITTYKKADVEEDRNSDVIESKSEDVNSITNAITIADNNVNNIDIGLQNKEIFDLQIGKYISKIVVTTKKETKIYEYDNVDLAKIDIHSKQIKGAKVELEYTVRIENKGSLEGCAEVVRDYLVEDVEFDESKNSEWYKGNDGCVYIRNANQIILKPGQSKEYKLNLSKVMTDENTGVLSNKVEILKSFSNSKEFEIIDNNIGIQNTIITISTGRTVQALIIFISIIAILSGVGYKNKLLLNINFNKVYKSKQKNISFKKVYK